MQKVAAMVINIAADLGLMASKVRWLLPKKYFEIAATSAVSLWNDNDLLFDDNINNLRGNQLPAALKRRSNNIVVLNTQRFGVFCMHLGNLVDKLQPK